MRHRVVLHAIARLSCYTTVSINSSIVGELVMLYCFVFYVYQEDEITSADVTDDGTVLAVISNDTYVLRLS